MSLRWRITLLTAALIAISVLLVGVGIYVVAARIQQSTVDRALVSALTDTRVRALAARPTTALDDDDVAIGIGRIDRKDRALVVLRHAGTVADPVPFPALTAAELDAAEAGPVTVAGSPDQRVLVRELRPGGARIVAAAPLTTLSAERTRLTRGIVSSAAIVAAIGALAAWLFVRRAFRPMDDMIQATGDIAAGDLSRRLAPARPGTELGELSTAVNAMIDSLSSSITQVADAQDRLRQFVSDASHEIRTPLTVISGYAEVLERSQAPRDEVETRALTRILAESHRLERLVSQLLLLDRIDTHVGDRQVVDLEPIVRDGFTDLAALGGRHVSIDATAALVRADPDAWRQLVANLAQNVERHTPPDAPVAVRLSAADGHVALVVDDAGPGIPVAERARVIDRFARGDGDTPAGFGLGMSIVAAVVRGADGELRLEDSPLGGLRIVVTVPSAGSTRDDG